jgi:apolipoprotein N-acyltransferase
MPEALPPTLFSRIGNAMALIVAVLLVLGAVAIRRRAR